MFALILIERAIKNERTGNNLLCMKRAYNKTKIVQWRLLNLNSLTKNTASESKTVVFLKSFLITSKFPEISNDTLSRVLVGAGETGSMNFLI